MSNRNRSGDEHLQDLPDGSGCTEIWEHLSAKRNEDAEKTDE